MQSAVSEDAGEALLGYIEAARAAQDALSQVLIQLAGYSLTLMTRSDLALRPEGSMLVARKAWARANEQLRGVRVPSSAAHHFHHLLELSQAIGHAFKAADRCSSAGAADADREDLTRALNGGVHHLRATGRLLPGFETVDFSQACCAVHRNEGRPQHAH